MADKRLGKGLDALIPSYATESSHIDGAVPITQITPNRNQPRQEFDPKKLEELTASIKENGIIQPLTVRELEEGILSLLQANEDCGLQKMPDWKPFLYIFSAWMPMWK